MQDELLPRWDARERHAIEVRADAARTYVAIKHVDLSRSWVVRFLFGLRGIRWPRGTTLQDVARGRFFLLGERPGEEIALGVVGAFWKLKGPAVHVSPERFVAFDEPGHAKAVWTFRVEALPDGRTSVSTETRVLATDEASRRKFLRYWRLVGPFSALIRRRALALVKRDAEASR